MYITNWLAERPHHPIVICPACDASDYDDCHIGQHLHREVVHEADGLVQEGRIDEAVDILSALYARHIADFVQPRWWCRCCRAKFHA